jgi:hypothetical protein
MNFAKGEKIASHAVCEICTFARHRHSRAPEPDGIDNSLIPYRFGSEAAYRARSIVGYRIRAGTPAIPRDLRCACEAAAKWVANIKSAALGNYCRAGY